MLAMFGFIASVILIYIGMQYYVAFWAIRNFPVLSLNADAVRIGVLLIALSFPLNMYCLRHFRGAWTGWFAYVSYIWLGVVFIWLSWAVLGDFVVLMARFWGAAERLRPWAAALVLAATASSVLWALCNAARMPRLTEVAVALPHLPRELEGFTIVQLSDLHLGVTVPLTKFARVVEASNGLHPDLVVLTGDILDAGLRDESEAGRIGARIKAPQGVFAVLGNHEFYHGVEDSARGFQEMGARLLRNEIVTLPCGLQVAGFDDLVAGGVHRGEMAAVLAKIDRSKPSLLLSHQPLAFDEAARAGVGLVLSGHTHQGQIFPFTLIVRLVYRYVYGLHREGNSWLYVTSGTGQWGPPMRLFTRAEIVRITLRRARS
jgi:predicted MPP superfamily phosphohydrolase